MKNIFKNTFKIKTFYALKRDAHFNGDYETSFFNKLDTYEHLRNNIGEIFHPKLHCIYMNLLI